MWGFALVLLPLVAAIGYGVNYVSRLTLQGQDAIYTSALAVQTSYEIVQRLGLMDRYARQYLVLGDPAIKRSYNKTRSQFLESARTLDELTTEPLLDAEIAALVSQEKRLHEQFNRAKVSGNNSSLTDKYSDLIIKAQNFSVASHQLIDKEVQKMRGNTRKTQKRMFWLATALIPMAVFFSIVFTVLISRPIRQISVAIRRMGDGQFADPINIIGPKDVEHLGKRLDWLRQRLLDLEEQKIRFLQHMSHELKTPLASIREGSQLLHEQVVGKLTDQQREISQIISASSLQLQHLIENIIEFSRNQSDSMTLNQAIVDLKSLIEDVARNHKLALMNRGVRLFLDLELVNLLADAGKLQSVVDNLISNAIKFSPTHGKILVRLRQMDNLAVFDIWDQGPGIAPQERDKVFNAFFQGEQTVHESIKGSGLGLSIARDYVYAHGGSIEVVSSAQRGAHFTVILPLVAIKAKAIANYS